MVNHVFDLPMDQWINSNLVHSCHKVFSRVVAASVDRYVDQVNTDCSVLFDYFDRNCLEIPPDCWFIDFIRIGQSIIIA